MEWTHLGDNCEYQIEGKTLLIKIDLDAAGVRSASGKSLIIASTRGNMSVDGVHVGLNVYRMTNRK
jgi:hypothetical protein